MIYNFLNVLIIAVMINIAFFLIAYINNTDKFTDISYALTFIIISIYQISHNKFNVPNSLLITMVLFWAFRLGAFLFLRILKIKKDDRFDEIRQHFIKFFFFWIFQAFSVIIILFPTLVTLRYNTFSFNKFSIFGITIWFLGFIIESIADFQKYMFRLKPKNKNKWIMSGLWKYSRHPNYFGEILLWLGIYFFTIFYLDAKYSIASMISPVYISVLLLYISGVPILEKKASARWGEEKSYLEYKNRTGLIIPSINFFKK